MLSTKQRKIAEKTIKRYREDFNWTTENINEGLCEEFAEFLKLNIEFCDHPTYSTCNFIIPPNDEQTDDIEEFMYMKDWKENAMALLGISPDYFQEYRKQVEAIDSKGRVAYHLWLFDGEHHYDAECLEGVKNPLELPFFQRFTKPRKYELVD